MPKQQFTFLDVATQWIVTLALYLVCLLLFWWITEVKQIRERIEAESKLNEKRDATLEAIREKIGNEELWQQVKPKIKGE